jgi:Ca2+-binding RTX toxin-like protein
MATFLNWGSSVGNRTIDTGGFFLIPETEAQRFARTGVALPANLDGKNDFGLGFKFTVEAGVGTFVLDDNGLKISSGLATYSAPPSGVVDLRAIGYPPGVLSSGVYINALDLTTIRLGDEDDRFALIGQGITQSLSAEVNKEASQGYIFQSNIFAGGGDDYLSVLMPWQSLFKGGSNTIYYDAVFGTDPGGGIPVTLDDEITLEEVPYGDLIVLKGSRFDWDIEFKDGDGDGRVTLASILDERDYIAVSNNNRIYGFERILFGDILFDLVLARQQDSSAIFGQPDYYLNGAENQAPELNSTIASGSQLWEAFRFNRTKLQGITGSATDQTQVFTGDANDTPFLVGALRFASLNTEAGTDIVEIGTPGQTAVEDASIDLGEGNDQLKVNDLFTRSSTIGGGGADSVILSVITSSNINSGTGDDVVQVTTSASQTSFDGGDGNDVLLLPGTFTSYQLTSSIEAAVVTFNDAFGNSITGFEMIRFSDINLDALQTLSLSGPPTPVNEGANASYIIALSDSGLASGNSVAFSLQLGDGTAQFSADLAALVQGSLQAAAGIVLSNLSVDAATGLIRAVASTSKNLGTGAPIATLAVPIKSDLLAEPDETFNLTLGGFIDHQKVTTTIRNQDQVTIRLAGPTSVLEGNTTSPYKLSLGSGVGLGAGARISFSIDTASGTATKGVDFAALTAAGLSAASGISLSGITAGPKGSISVTASNSSGVDLAAGSALMSFRVGTINDRIAEGNETFSLHLAGGAGVVVAGPAKLSTTISDDDPLSIQLGGPRSLTEGQRSQPYTLSLGPVGLAVDQSIPLQIGLRSGSAQAGSDLSPLGFSQLELASGLSISDRKTLADGTLLFSLINRGNRDLAPSSQLLSFQLNPLADKLMEGAESFSLHAALQGSVSSEQQLPVSIADLDKASLALRGPASVNEGALTQPFSIELGTAALAQGQQLELTLGIAGLGGSSVSKDYQPLTTAELQLASGLSIAESQQLGNGGLQLQLLNGGSQPIPVGTALVQFGVLTNADELIEKGEAVEVSLTSSSAGIKPSASRVRTAIVDISKPAIEPPPDNGGDDGSVQPPPSKVINGTPGPDVLVGSSLNNVIYGGKGADLITGGGGSNVFRFNLRDGLNQGDVITDFRPGADVIRVESVPRNSLAAAAFGGKTSLQSAGAKSAFETVDTLDRSDRSKAVFLYARLTGELAYNGNGSGSGFGRGGGVITSLPVLLAFDPRDLQLAYI